MTWSQPRVRKAALGKARCVSRWTVEIQVCLSDPSWPGGGPGPAPPGLLTRASRGQTLLLSHHVSRHVRLLQAPQVGPPLRSRSVSGSAGWGSGAAPRWPCSSCPLAHGSGLGIRDSNKNGTKHTGCVCVWWGGHFQKSEANLPSTAWGERRGRGESSLTKVPVASSPYSQEPRDARGRQWPLRVY